MKNEEFQIYQIINEPDLKSPITGKSP